VIADCFIGTCEDIVPVGLPCPCACCSAAKEMCCYDDFIGTSCSGFE